MYGTKLPLKKRNSKREDFYFLFFHFKMGGRMKTKLYHDKILVVKEV
jgi:hypothetical protein